MTEGAAPRAVLWCRHCEEPARRAGGGDGPLGKVVHAGTGDERCADGKHVAAPTDVNPGLAGIARRVMADEPDYDVAVNCGVLLRATLRGVVVPVPVEAWTEAELRDGIARQKEMREIAARFAAARAESR
ncbi:MAG: hypothetical protein J2P25_03465 [Nocardiopsaceae bacterium]|nr:hypothetical protein [Nocardiopsaceae bacterium]